MKIDYQDGDNNDVDEAGDDDDGDKWRLIIKMVINEDWLSRWW